MGIVVAPAGGQLSNSVGADAEEVGEVSPRVLLVDRQPLFMEALSSLLCAPPLEAETGTATRSDDAVAAAIGGSVDLVLCDVLAEPLDGQAVVRALAALEPRIPVILIGEMAEIGSALPLMLEGAAGLFTKDVAPADLVAGVEAALAGHQVLGANLLPMVFASGALPAAPPLLAAASRLSPAEREVLTMVGRGRSVVEIASIRQISQKTVRNHMASIYRKLDLNNRVEAMLFAARLGLSREGGEGAPAAWADDPPRPGTPVPAREAIPIAPNGGHWDDA
jgi:DNA-binding NarL/FixJ family response regulator